MLVLGSVILGPLDFHDFIHTTDILNGTVTIKLPSGLTWIGFFWWDRVGLVVTFFLVHVLFTMGEHGKQMWETWEKPDLTRFFLCFFKLRICLAKFQICTTKKTQPEVRTALGCIKLLPDFDQWRRLDFQRAKKKPRHPRGPWITSEKPKAQWPKWTCPHKHCRPKSRDFWFNLSSDHFTLPWLIAV